MLAGRDYQIVTAENVFGGLDDADDGWRTLSFRPGRRIRQASAVAFIQPGMQPEPPEAPLAVG